MRNQAARRDEMPSARDGGRNSPAQDDWSDGYDLRGGYHYGDGQPQAGQDEPEYDPRYYAPNPEEPYGYDDDGRPLYYEPEPTKLKNGGRSGLMMIGAVVAVALVGGAGAVGYKMMSPGGFSGEPPLIKADTEPVKTTPKQSPDQTPNKAIYDRVDPAGAKSKMVSREEKPVDIPSAPPAEPRSADSSRIILPNGPASAPSVAPDTQGSDTRRVKTMAIRPSVPATAGESRPPANDPVAETARAGQTPRSEFDDGILSGDQGGPQLAAVPNGRPTPTPKPAPAPQAQRPATTAAPALRTEPGQVATVAPRAPAPAAPPAATQARAAPGGGFVVQVTSQRSEADARTAYGSLQRKFPGVLGAYQPTIQSAEVAGRGTYYRARVGPFSSSADASTVCNNLRAAGGDCVVQRN